MIIHGDCLEVMANMPDASVDSVVTDPPYLIGFMGKSWDAANGIAGQPEVWAECLRVLKPGGHLLAFGATRTYHRMAVAIEDAGFEIRDSIHWLYGSGFPKSLDVSKAIDKAAGAEREVVGHVGNPDPVVIDRVALDYGGATGKAKNGIKDGHDITAPATDAARQWSGWGTALKPAHEPIVVARKPLTGTVASNVLAYGVGALNIDECRVDMGDEYDPTKVQRQQHSDGAIDGAFGASALIGKEIPTYKPGGRWPANLVFTHAADCADVCADGCPVAELDGQSGVSKSAKATAHQPRQDDDNNVYGHGLKTVSPTNTHNDAGGASRFFTVTEWDPTADVAPFRYVAKPSKRERNAGLDGLPEKDSMKWAGGNEMRGLAGTYPDGTPRPAQFQQNTHPTVKPVALMRWLVRLVTPPGGTVLDPFAGSGTTLVAAVLEGFDAIGIEMTDDYLPIIEGRLDWARNEVNGRLL